MIGLVCGWMLDVREQGCGVGRELGGSRSGGASASKRGEVGMRCERGGERRGDGGEAVALGDEREGSREECHEGSGPGQLRTPIPAITPVVFPMH